MLHVDIHCHKRYSQAKSIAEGGKRQPRSLLTNGFSQIESFFRSLGEPCRVALEAGWNGGVVYD